jgi:hypothetical protein
MADLNKIISVNIDDNASAGLKKVDQNLTKVTQSTKNLTKETQGHTQSVLDNGGAMGLLNELTGGLAMTFKDASEAISLAGVSLKSFRGIMIATGIGALVVAVGLLAENWEAVSDAIGLTNSAQEKQNKLIRESILLSQVEYIKIEDKIKAYEDETKSIGERQKALDEIAKTITVLSGLRVGPDEKIINNAIDSYIKLIELKDQLKKAEDKFTEARNEEFEARDATWKTEQARLLGIFEAEKKVDAARGNLKNIQKQIDLYEKDLGIAKERTDELKKLEETKEANAKAEEQRIAALNKFNEEYYKKLQDLDADTEMKKINLQEKRALLDLKELSTTEEFEKNKYQIYEYYERLRIELRSKYRIQEEKEDAKANKAFNEGLVKQWEDYQQNQFKVAETDRLTKEAQLEQWMMYWDNVYSITDTAQSLLAVLQDDQLIRAQGLRDALLISEKGLAIAGVWINEAQSTAMATASANAVPTTTNIPGPYGPITIPNPMKPVAMAGAVKAGVTNKINAGIATAAILAQTIAGLNKRGSGGGSASGGVGNQAPQAQFNIVGSSGTNQLAATIGAQQNQPVNAYVVGTDVSTQQALDRNRITNATFL